MLERLKIRSEVMAFAREMEIVLQANEHKGGWLDCDEEYLARRLFEELSEVFTTKNRIKKRCEMVDMANFLMMWWGNSQP